MRSGFLNEAHAFAAGAAAAAATFSQEKASRSKRKYRADPPSPLAMPESPPSCEEGVVGRATTNGSESARNHRNSKITGGLGGGALSHPNSSSILFHVSRRTEQAQGGGGPIEEEPGFEEELSEPDWDHFSEAQLEGILLKSLDSIYRDAVKKMVSSGISEGDALDAVLKNGGEEKSGGVAFAGLKSAVSSSPLPESGAFADLNQMEMHVLEEMVGMLRKVRPFLSRGDAMWCLLMCDLNVAHACAMEDDGTPAVPPPPPTRTQEGVVGGGPSSSGPCSPLPPQRNPNPNSNSTPIPNPSPLPPQRNPNSNSTPIPSPSPNPNPNSSSNPNPGTNPSTNPSPNPNPNQCKGVPSAFSAPSFKPLPRRQRNLDTRLSSAAAKCTPIVPSRDSSSSSSLHLAMATTDGTSGSLKGNIDESLKSPPLPSVCTDAAEPCPCSLARNGAGSDLIPLVENSAIESGAGVGVRKNEDVGGGGVVTAETQGLELSLSVNAGALSNNNGQNLGSVDPRLGGQDEASSELYGWIDACGDDGTSNEMLVQVLHRSKELEAQLQEWTEWAQQKVMQAAKRLGKDAAELKQLRQEHEEYARLKREKQALEESTMKKLTEMENALRKASAQVERANASVRRLEMENAEARAEMEAAKLGAAEAMASCTEATKREKKLSKKSQGWEKQKGKLQEELAKEKQKLSHLQMQLSQAKEQHQQAEVRWRQERRAKEEAMLLFESEKRAKEQVEAAIKRKEVALQRKAEEEGQRHRDDVQRLEEEISHLRMSSEGGLQPGKWGSFNRPNLQLNAQLLREITECQEYSPRGAGVGVGRDRECVMCMTEEMSVVFLPCAHQVVCIKCNEKHEKQGLTDCPSCRTPIQRRIRVYGVSS